MRAVLETADIAIVALYFILVMCIGFFAMWKSNRSTVSGYFLAGALYDLGSNWCLSVCEQYWE